MKHILFFILLSSLSLLSFSQQDTFNLFPKKEKKDAVKEITAHTMASKLDSVYYIKYGKNVSICTGYCFHEATIDSNITVTVSKAGQADKNYPTKTDTVQTTPAQWSMLISSLDISSFFTIPEKIFNQDHEEKIYEWVELNYAGKLHKLTFDSTGPEEYEGIKNLDKQLKKITGF